MNNSLNENEAVTFRLFKDKEKWKRFQFFDQNFIKIINIHWLSFDPPSEADYYILAILYIVIMGIGFSGNVIVILMFSRRRSLQTPANVLVANLAVSDLLMMLKMPIFIFNSFFLGPALGSTGCQIYGFVGGLSGTCSICTLAAISLDRYYVIKFPLNMRFTNLRAKICIAVSWFYSLIFSSLPFFAFGSFVPEGYLTSCSFDYLTRDFKTRIFIFVFFVAAWVVPFGIICFCYANIFQTVLKKPPTRKDSESSRHMKMEEKRRQETKLALTILIIIGLWFFAWTPYAIVALLGIFDRADLISPMVSMIPALFCKTSACFNPIVYAITNAKFKEELRKVLCTKRKKRKDVVWSSQRTVGSERISMCYTHSRQASEDVEEEIIPVPMTELKSLSKEVSTERQTPKEMSHVKPQWWYRPSFSNRSSSLRGFARSLKQKPRSDSCDYCEDDLGEATTNI